MERIFYNLVLYKSSLFKNFSPEEIPDDNGYFFPLAYVVRESTWTQSQVDSVFSDLIRGQKLRWVFFSLLLFFGLVFAGLTTFCGFKYCKLREHINLPPKVSDSLEVDPVVHPNY